MKPRFLVSRLAQAAFVLLGVSFTVFALSHLSGDPVSLMVGPTATQADIDALRRSMNLDHPFFSQYAAFLGGVLRGDFGTSLWQHQPAIGLVLERFPYTIQLAAAALLLALLVAVPLGILSAVFRNSFLDRLAIGTSLVGQSVPGFWLGLLLILLFSVTLRLLPTGGSGSLKHLILPAVTLASFTMGRIARLVRTNMLEVLGSDSLRTARAKGLREFTVVIKHGLRNAAIPIVTLIGLDASALLGGAVITETIFAWPGLGRLVVQAISQRDFPLVQAATLCIAVIVVGVNLLVDLSYSLLDPRVNA
ncbi:MAG: ABC transporter permease [Trueperaceae bacterium]|nr:ABC transporter permease [Trueperaceae bacterium]MCO5174539.1 ABC transporter permease [Trueperaceae bacterium]MCW5818902.1 ABC transporter permease [Trueperaceae bacterium]